MKLRKLLPLATIASTAAIVTPLVTSCGKSTFGFTLETYKNYEFVEPKTGSLSKDEITNVYFEDASKNVKIYADDLLAPLVSGLPEVVPEGTNGKTSVTVKNINTEKHTINVVYYFKGKTITDIPPQNAQVEMDMETTIELTKIPFFIDYLALDGGSYHWTLMPTYGDDLAKWKADADWSIKEKGYVLMSHDGKKVEEWSEEYDDLYNSTNVDETKAVRIANLFGQYFTPSSHYLSKVTLKE